MFVVAVGVNNHVAGTVVHLHLHTKAVYQKGKYCIGFPGKNCHYCNLFSHISFFSSLLPETGEAGSETSLNHVQCHFSGTL